jgi:L-rhamnose mutarotase
MERVCFLARVRPECLAQYRDRHQEVWPEMLAALRDAGWGNYSLFLADDGLLIGYVETEDYQAALDAMAATDVNQRWQAAMAGFFVADGPPDQNFRRIAEIFHLDSREMTPNA